MKAASARRLCILSGARMSGISEANNPERGVRRPEGAGEEGGVERSRERRDVARLFEQLPPHAIEAEMSVLGSMLIEPHVIGDVVMVLRSGGDFYKAANGAIFDAMLSLYDEHGSLDIVQLNQLLVDRDTLGTVGGLPYLVELASAVPSAANVLHYARLVREKATIRRLIEAAGEVLYESYTNPEDAQLVLERAEQRIFKIAQQSEQSHAEALEDLLRQAMELIESNESKQITGVPTGFIDLDRLMHGLQWGEMVILAARPSMGKTALALNVAEHMALGGYGVGIFSLEMSKQQLVQRLLASRSGVDSQKIRRSMLNREEHHALQHACDDFREAQIFIDDTPGLTLLQLRAKARRMVLTYGIKAIIIDYLQLMSSGRRAESRQLEISEISRGVKAMARELEIPVFCLSQLNRSPEQREGHRPRMSDLRESGSLEQDADVVMMLHRESYYHQKDPDYVGSNEGEEDLAELIITKQRNGPVGTVNLSWDSRITRFRDYSAAMAPGGYFEGGSNAPARGGLRGGKKAVGGFRDGGEPDRDEDGDLPI